MNPNVNYGRVVDALADAIRELNRAPHAPHAPHAELSSDDVACAIYEILLALERGDGSGIADAAADAAAEHGASSQEFAFLLPFLPFVPVGALGVGAISTALQAYAMFGPKRRSGRRGR